MSVWRRTGTEVAGAWRSLRYDMGRRPFEPPAGGPDVTSTGMNTFGGGVSWDLGPDYRGPDPTEMPIAGRRPRPRRRAPRRAMAVSALGLLTVTGAAAAYLVVVNGLVPIRDEGPAAAGTVPPTGPAESRLGHSPGRPATGPATRRPARIPATPAMPAKRIEEPPVRTEVVAPLPTPPREEKRPKPTSRICCIKPPVPTPTAPASSPSPTPSESPSPSASATSSDDPSESPEPRRSWHHRHPD